MARRSRRRSTSSAELPSRYSLSATASSAPPSNSSRADVWAGPAGTRGKRLPLPITKTVDLGRSEIRDWQTLLGDGSVRRLHLTIGEVNDAFQKSGNAAAAANPEPGEPGDTFIDLYVALVSVPTIGRSLLGDDGTTG